MRAKFINEDIKGILKPKSKEEILKTFKEIQISIKNYLVEENINFSKFIFDTNNEKTLDDFIIFAKKYLSNSPFSNSVNAKLYTKAYSKFGPFIFVIDWDDLRGYLTQKKIDHTVDMGSNYNPISHGEFMEKYF